MTNALANNIDNLINNTYTDNSKNSKMHSDGTFSNLMNTIDAKLQKTQTKFVDKAVKTNTSSINKFVLKNSKTELPKENKADVKTETTSKTTEQQPSQDIETAKEDTSKNKVTKENTTENKIKQETKISSDINDNSPVDPSPVFSLNTIENETRDNKPSLENGKELKDVENVLLVLDANKSEDLDTTVDNSELQVENPDEIIKTIDNISSMLDNSDLSQDKKENLSSALDKIKTKIRETQKNLSDLNETKDETQDILNGLLSKLSKKSETSSSDNEILPQKETNEDIEQSENLLSDSSKEIREISDKINTIIDKNDTEALIEINENIDEIMDRINNLCDKTLKDKKQEVIDFDKKLVQILTTAAENIKEEGKNEEFSADLVKVSEMIEDTNPDLDAINKELAQKADKINFKNPEKTDKKALEDALKTFENIKSTENFDEDLEIKADDIIKKINSSKTDNSIENEVETEQNNQQDNKNPDLKKQNFIDKLNEKMLADVEFQNITEAQTTLSVSDEVIKLSMNDTQSPLNSNTAIGNITYDNSLIIKNVSQNIKMPQEVQTEAEPLNDVFNQITNKITELKDAQQGQRLTMVLRPNDLGRLSIELTTNAQGLSANLMAQNDDVRNYIEKNINALRQQLSEAGVNVNNIQIKTAGQDGTSNYDGNKNPAQNNENNEHNQNNQQENKNQHNQKEAKETLLSMSDYETHFAKDFSSVLNKSINYSLN